MCASQCRWMNCRGQCTPALLILLPLSFLSFTFAQGEHHNPNTMLQPPVLTQMPTSRTIFFWEDIDLRCEATGNPTPTFRWVKDGELFGSEHVGSGTLNAVKLEEEAEADEGNSLELYGGHFRCYASNTLGTAMTQTVKVIVEPQPVLQRQPLIHKTAFQGESIILPCNRPESSTHPSIIWMDRKLMHITRSDRVTLGLDGNLYFANLEMRDTQVDLYICHAQYKEARTILPVTSVSLTVKQRDDFHGGEPDFFHPADTHSSVMALRGHRFTLECIPKGLPTPKVEWKKKDGILENTTGQVANFDRWLRFDSITQDDDGEYECKASNIHGFATRSFTVTVEAAPYWVKKPQSLTCALGETVELDCQAEGTPKPTITWRVNGVLITEVDENPRRTVSSGLMILSGVDAGDTAVYQCEATNVHGSILLNAYVYVIEIPFQLLLSRLVIYEAVEGGDITLLCKSLGLPRPYITWEREDKFPLLSDPRVSLEIDGALKLSNVSLKDSGDYTCFIANTYQVITAELLVFNRTVILKGPQDLRALRGTTVFLDCHFYVDPRLRSRRVAWKQGSHKLSQDDDKYTIFENGTLKVVDVQLNDNSEYTCEVTTNLDYVNAKGSITVIVPPDPPNYLSLSNVEGPNPTLSWIPGRSNNSPITEPTRISTTVMNSAVTVSWNEAQKVRGQLLGYKIYIKRLGPQEGQSLESDRKDRREEEEGGERSEQGRGRDEDSRVVVVDPDKTSTEVTGLRPFSQYELTVTAFNSKGQSPHSQPHRFNTPEGAPGPPASLRLESPTETSLILFWTPPRETNGILQGYTVQYQQEVESKVGPVGMMGVSDPTVNYVRLNHLDPDSHYIFSVCAHTRAGVGPVITGRGATLLYGVPPTNVTVVSNITSVSLSWVLGERCRRDGFRVHYLRRSGEWRESEVVSSAFYTLTGLEPGSVYHLRMTHGNRTVWEGEVKTAEAGRLSVTSWLIRVICSIILTTVLVLIPIILKWRQGSKYREHPLTATPGSAREDSTYQNLDPASRDLEQTCSPLIHHT